MSFARYATAIALALSLQGCMMLPFWPRNTPRIDIAPVEATSDLGAPGHIPVTTGDLDVAYKEVAVLTVGPRGLDSTQELIADLRRAALQAEADAVVRVDFDQYADEDGFTLRIATGTAVRYAR